MATASSARTARSRQVRAASGRAAPAASGRATTARTAHARPAPVRPRPRVVGGRPVRAGAIRWDRVGKLVVWGLAVLVTLLYAHPLLSYWSTRESAGRHRAEVARLAAEQRRLHDRIAALRGDKALEREARRLGMVRRGERAYVITNLSD